MEKNIIMKQQNIYTWFTLIELIISITIFSVMMISVMSIFLFSSQMSTRVELNRSVQENIKNVIEDIAESVRTQWIWGVRNFAGTCKLPTDTDKNIIGIGLCVGWSDYIIGYKTPTGNFMPSSNISADCWDLDDSCRILKKEASGDYYPLTNSFLAFEKLSFIVNNTDVPKVTIQFIVRPAYKKWLSPDILRNNTMHIQTTISERLIKTY